MPTHRSRKWECHLCIVIVVNIASITVSVVTLVIVLVNKDRETTRGKHMNDTQDASLEKALNTTTRYCIISITRRCVLHLEIDSRYRDGARLVISSTDEEPNIQNMEWDLQDAIINHPTTSHSPMFRTSPVTAHLAFKLPDRVPGTEHKPDPNFSNTDQVVMRIELNDTKNCHKRGVTVNDNGIVILFPGLYYIYSGVKFRPNTTLASSEFPYQTWIHYVLRQSPNSPVNSNVLLRSVHTVCPNCARSQETAFTGGIFYLSGGDILQGTLSGQGTVKYNGEYSFLGLFLISSSKG